MTGGKAKRAYPIGNAELCRSVAGKIPSKLKQEHRHIDGMPHDYMPEIMLGMLSYSERAVESELRRRREELGRFMTVDEASDAVKVVTETTCNYFQAINGIAIPLLKISPKK